MARKLAPAHLPNSHTVPNWVRESFHHRGDPGGRGHRGEDQRIEGVGTSSARCGGWWVPTLRARLRTGSESDGNSDEIGEKGQRECPERQRCSPSEGLHTRPGKHIFRKSAKT